MSWKIFAVGGAVFAGLTAYLSKMGVRDISSNQATLIRVIVILPLLAALVAVRQEWTPLEALSTKSLVFLVLSGVATGLSWLCYYRALQVGPAALVASVDKLSLVVAVVLSVLLLKERLNEMQWLGVALITIGSLLVAWK